MSSQQPRRSARASRNSRADLKWTAGFFAAAVIGGVASHQFLLGHASISWPVTFAVALVVAAALGAVLRTGVLDERQSAARHGGTRPDGGQPADPSRYGGQRPPVAREAPAGPSRPGGSRTGEQPTIPASDSLAAPRTATGPQAIAPSGRNQPPGGWWQTPAGRDPQDPGAAPPVVPVMDPGMASTVTMLDPAGKGLPPGTSRPGSSLQAEAVIAQCPGCGSFRMDASVRSGNWQFRCHECQHEWTWKPGTPWPEVQVRPDHGRRGPGAGRMSRRRTS